VLTYEEFLHTYLLTYFADRRGAAATVRSGEDYSEFLPSIQRQEGTAGTSTGQGDRGGHLDTKLLPTI